MALKIIDPDKKCQHCGASFKRRDGENRTDYLKRKSCSRSCSLKITHGAQPVSIVRVHDAIVSLDLALKNWRRAA